MNCEISTGQQVPQGLHYRINLQTGYKEAKILDELEKKTEVQSIPGEQVKDEEIEKNSDVYVDESRKRLEEALKNIPADIYIDENTEERWKELSKKYRSYKEIKDELKDLELNVKTENEIMNELVSRFSDEKLTTTVDEKLIILEDIEYLAHAVDNALHLISIGGFEKLIIPNFNHSNEDIRNKCFKLVGVILQNNNKAKQYASESTNIGEHLISAMSRAINLNHEKSLSSLLFAYGCLIRNNEKITQDYLKKGLILLINISGNSNFPLSLKTKAVILIGDTLLDEKMKIELETFIKGSKVCNQLVNYFTLNRNGLIADIDMTNKFLNSILDLQNICQYEWSESSEFRHNLLVILSHCQTQLNDIDEDLKFLYHETVEQLKKLNEFLFGHLIISEDDLKSRFDDTNYVKMKTEL